MYGKLPKLLGRYNINVQESMLYLYMPIKLPNTMDNPSYPKRLLIFQPLINRVVSEMKSGGVYFSNAIYITAKHSIVTPNNPGNRPGYHSDGFMTKDINYIWYDYNPTIFSRTEFA